MSRILLIVLVAALAAGGCSAPPMQRQARDRAEVAAEPPAKRKRAPAKSNAGPAGTETAPAPNRSAPPTTSRLTAAAVTDPPPFYGTSSRLPDAVRERMRGISWRKGCPVPLWDLRLLRMSYWGYDGAVHRGRMVVHEDVAQPVLSAFKRIYGRQFKFRQIRLIDDYGGSDDKSMAANNTSAFNCRYVKGTTRWSEHSYGKAIDINPIQNPYVKGDFVDPPAGKKYLDRSNARKGMIIGGWIVTDSFDAISWGWGGRWRYSKDYQHVSRSGS